ncbi:M15 family metallopeptidase [Aminobacter sp. HY435]|uniref:M15 family metallopeptidase n=1 Tax=Aminobacter sp. HY435 TaxID=2970917 RepID=UPI0022B9A42B|nr:M15 family metallopeptidase [Aminobacter sp. HY435]
MRLLKGVHPDLVKVVLKAAELSDIPFKVIEGLRSVERQRELVRIGASTTMNSRHLTGHAVDIVPLVDLNRDGKISSAEMFAWPLYRKLAAAMKEAARQVGVALEWGGDWRKFKDGPHWQLPFAVYPKGANSVAALGAFSEEVMSDHPTDYETDQSAAYKAVASAGGSVTLGGSLAADPLANLVDGIAAQQYELTSGEGVRIAIAVVIIGVGLWFAYKKAKGGGA